MLTVPGGSFFPNGGKEENHFRLNYSCMPEDKIVERYHKDCRGSESKPANNFLLTQSNQALLFGGLFYAEIDSPVINENIMGLQY